VFNLGHSQNSPESKNNLVPRVAPRRHLADEAEAEEHAETDWHPLLYGPHVLLLACPILRTQAHVVHRHGPGLWPHARGAGPQHLQAALTLLPGAAAPSHGEAGTEEVRHTLDTQSIPSGDGAYLKSTCKDAAKDLRCSQGPWAGSGRARGPQGRFPVALEKFPDSPGFSGKMPSP
jgi:hypothetical protein